jgi:hypothetical protein
VTEPCPNGCDDRHVKRKDMAEHVRDHCPLTSVPCKFGCSQAVRHLSRMCVCSSSRAMLIRSVHRFHAVSWQIT